MPAGNALNQGGQALPLPATWKLRAFEIRAARGSGCLGADSIPSRVLPPAILPGEGGCLAGPSRSSEGQADGLSPLSGPRLRPRKCRVTFEVDSHSRVVS